MAFSHSKVGVAVSVLITGVIYILCFWSGDPLISSLQHSSPPAVIDELEAVLESAGSGNNKTVVITMVNKAYVEKSGASTSTVLDLFLESLWEGEGTRHLLDHLLLVAVDQTAYDRCRFLRLHCYRLELTDQQQPLDFSGEKVYMSPDFIQMMWRRTLFLLQVLRHRYSFIFTDTDVMWLRNPFSRLNKNESVDLQISRDSPNDHFINTGFYHIRSNEKTISLFEKWYSMKDNSTGMKEQDVLKSLLDSGFFDTIGLTVNFLETVQFSGFCNDSPDFGAVTTVHANCCRHIPAKIADLTAVLNDWKRYKVAVGKRRSGHKVKRLKFRWTPHDNCWGSWNDTHYKPRQ
ncbi:PREDICTED: uncharacterized protein At1g28695-like [Tarenaya hassleriana]|uniref:uncharacterized protein At1g28695-like n=1 Tax=Tarenaya hassleriana TaxID=28532 RepID=UPI00053C8F68|nr:PREDICTED: uncharacterized protein At1g28695-like [Tarenaya hassleriana]